MNRNSFLKTCLTVSAYLAAPFFAAAKTNNNKRLGKGLKVNAGKDRYDKPVSLFEGDTFYTKVATKDSDGDIFVFESTRIKEGGPSFHLHYDQDEFWYIVTGEFLFKVGEETFTAKAGDTVFGPRQVPHAFAKVGEGEARLMMFFSQPEKWKRCSERSVKAQQKT